MATWIVEATDEFASWLDSLPDEEYALVATAIDMLEMRGPTLGRPWVDKIQQSRLHNLKELRPRSTSIRVLFAFDPRRTAILLLGGNKAGLWNNWYLTWVPVAERLYEEYLREIEEERGP
jgi:hypothetical protein